MVPEDQALSSFGLSHQPPRIGQRTDRTVDQRRAAARQGAGDRRAELGRRLGALRGDAEALAELHEVRIVQVRGDGAALEGLLLDALDVAIGASLNADEECIELSSLLP